MILSASDRMQAIPLRRRFLGAAPIGSLAALILLGLVVGCGSSGNQPPQPSQSPKLAEQPASDTAKQPPPRTVRTLASPETSVPATLLQMATKPSATDEVAADATSDATSEGSQALAANCAFQTLVEPGVGTEQWEQAQQKLLSLGPAAVPVLVEALENGDAFQRETAVTVLALMGSPSPEAVPALLKLLEDPSSFVRANAATALILSPQHAATAVPVLIDLLKSDDSQMRQLAATNLELLGPDVPIDVEKLADSLADGESADVLLPVVELLGRIGPAAGPAVPKLERIAFEHSGDLREAATHALNQIRSGQKE